MRIIKQLLNTFIGIGIFIGICIYLLYLISIVDLTNIKRIPVKEQLKDTVSIKLTKPNVYNYIKKCNIMHPDIVYAQVILETGHLTSYNCIVRNNLFGFQTSKGYLKFTSWKDSVKYYANWQNRHYKGGDYYTFLVKRGYSEDSNYVDILKQIKI